MHNNSLDPFIIQIHQLYKEGNTVDIEVRLLELVSRFKNHLESLHLANLTRIVHLRELKYLEKDLIFALSKTGNRKKRDDRLRATLKQFLVYIELELELLHEQKTPQNQKPDPTVGIPLTWTSSKSNLVELIYALYVARWINNGQIEISELSEQISRIFNIELTNLYSIFRDIRARKSNTLKGLEQLAEALMDYIKNFDSL